MEDFTKAVHKWKLLLADRYCVTDHFQLEKISQATLKKKSNILALLKPKNLTEVKACLKISHQFHIPLYPLSRGYNWGYGSKLPVTSKAVILSLERMNKIIEFNEDLAYITVEPGVTFQQVFDFLRKRHSSLYLSVSGTTPHASLVGNVLERGINFGLGGNHIDEVCNFEVVLPNGNVIHTSNKRYQSIYTVPLRHSSPGPLLESLFTQSNFGVVTKVTFLLRKIPAQLQYIGFQVPNSRDFIKMIPVIRELIQEDVISPVFNLINDNQILNMVLNHYPWELMSHKTPLSNQVKKQLKQMHDIGDWQGGFLVYASGRNEGKEKYATIIHRIGPFIDTLFHIKATRKKCLAILENAYQKKLNKLSPYKMLALSLGLPDETGLRFSYWRKKFLPKKNLDPDRDQCGVIWLPIILPITAQAITQVQSLTNKEMARYRFEPKITLKFISSQAVCFNLGIIYDRETSGEDDRALKCYKTILKKVSALGYYPYRLTIQSMDLMKFSADDTANLIRQLKNVIDPLRLLAPGRYDGS